MARGYSRGDFSDDNGEDMTLFDPAIGEDAWVTFECVACGCSVHTLVPNPEQRCGVCQFISECAPEDQDGLRDLLIRGGATP
jgi:hypothetical protein